MEPARQPKYYTIDDIYNLPEGKRAELIDGEIYMLAAPSIRLWPQNLLIKLIII